MRYGLLVFLCRLLRHPSRREQYADGGGLTRCPCDYIHISDRPFKANSR